MASALGLIALLAVLYLYVLPRDAADAVATSMEDPGPAGSATPVHPLAKYIEITGVRVREGGRGQARIGYVIVNHSPADLPALEVGVTLRAGDNEVFSFPAKIPSIGPYESKDLTATVKTQLQPYELPDWQTLQPSVRITSE